MSRRRKVQRKRGGRVTPRKDGAGLLPAESLAQNAPPAAVPDPVPDDDPAAAAIALFEPMVSQLDPHRDDHPADVEYIACELVGLLRTIADDEPVPGGESGLRPSELLGETSPGNADEMLTAAVLALTDSQRFRPDAQYVDCIRPFLPFCTAEARPELELRLAQLEAKVGAPDWADAVWNATAVAGWHSFDDLGDLSNVGVELSWPGDWSDRVLFGSIVVEHGPFTQEFIAIPMEDYLKAFTPDTPWPDEVSKGDPCRTDVIRHLEPMAAEEAVGRLLRAMDATERMGAPTTEDYFAFAPFARQTLAGLPSIDPPEPTPATDEEREEMVGDFLNADGVAFALGFDNDPGFARQVGEFSKLFIDYSVRFAGGDRYRWSPMVVEGFLHHYGDNIISNARADGLLEPALGEWIRFCHRHRGWPQSVTVQCLLTIEEHLDCAIGDDAASLGDELPAPHRAQLSRLSAELGTDTDDPDSMQELTDTWHANEGWPDDEAAPMPWARIPDDAVERCEEVLAIAEPVLEDLFAHHHVTSARRMVADLAVDHTAGFLRGRADVWAAGIVYAVAQVHFAFDTRGITSGATKKLTPQQLIDAFPSVSKASITSRATKVRDLLDANGPGRARYERFAAALGVLPYVDRDKFLSSAQDVGQQS